MALTPRPAPAPASPNLLARPAFRRPPACPLLLARPAPRASALGANAAAARCLAPLMRPPGAQRRQRCALYPRALGRRRAKAA
eukprot:3838959-Pyramimonas_sp.AAC.1